MIDSAPPAAAIYEARGLAKEYDNGQVRALRGVDFTIQPGEFVTIVGQSGSGKSTLLQLLGALDFPSTGQLLHRGQALSEVADPAAYRAREIGFIFQAFHLLPTFTALENVQLAMFGTEPSAAKRRERAAELLDSVGLAKRHDHFPAKLSGGERQRVAIARSLANRPSVLLADEPTGNLDSENASVIMALIDQLHREQKMTLVLVTHDLGVARHGTRVFHMKDGRIDWDGPPAELPKAA